MTTCHIPLIKLNALVSDVQENPQEELTGSGNPSHTSASRAGQGEEPEADTIPPIPAANSVPVVPENDWYTNNNPAKLSDAKLCEGLLCTQKEVEELWKLLQPVGKIVSLAAAKKDRTITFSWADAVVSQPLPQSLKKFVLHEKQDWVRKAITYMIVKLVLDEWKHPGTKPTEFPRMLVTRAGFQQPSGGRLFNIIANINLEFRGHFVLPGGWSIQPWLVKKADYSIHFRSGDFVLRLEQGANYLWISFTLETSLRVFIQRYQKGYPELVFN